MRYNQFFVKKRLKTKVIDGHANLPYGTICPVDGEFICHGDKRLCAITSQNAIDHFWGYDPSNPEQEIERQKLARKLHDTAPNENGDTLADQTNTWNNYGGLIEYAAGMTIWQWRNDIFDLSHEKLLYLLDCTMKGVRPIV